MQMEYGQAIGFPRRERGWIVKLAIASVVNLIPVIGQVLVAGYGQEIASRVYRDDVNALPDWSNVGTFFRRGILWLIVVIVYMLPLALFGALLAGANYGVDLVMTANGPSEGLRSAGLVVSLCFNVLVIGYGLVAGLTLIAATGRLAVENRFGAAFQLGTIWADIRRQPGMYLIVLIINVVAFVFLPALGVIGCGVGTLVGLAYATWISSYLAGEAYQVSRSRAGATDQ